MRLSTITRARGPQQRRRWQRTGSIAVSFALLVGSCGTAEPEVAPFDAVLLELFDTTDTDAYLASAERHAAELVVTCMEQAGFRFAIPPEQDDLDPPRPRSIDDARAVGFGIIADYRYLLDQTDFEAQFAPDPNQLYLATLTAAEVERFLITLDGEQAAPGQRQQGGCNGAASDEAYADWLAFFEVLPNFTTLGEERDTHPDWLAARADWRDCMADRGFDYSEPDAIRTDVIRRMRETVEAAYPGSQLPLIEQDGVLMVDPAVDVLLDELLEFEIAAAVANVECTEPLADRFDEVERLVQQAFVDRHQQDIDQLLDEAK